MFNGKGRREREDDNSAAIRYVDLYEVYTNQFMGVGAKVDRKFVMYDRWLILFQLGMSRSCKEHRNNKNEKDQETPYTHPAPRRIERGLSLTFPAHHHKLNGRQQSLKIDRFTKDLLRPKRPGLLQKLLMMIACQKNHASRVFFLSQCRSTSIPLIPGR